MFLGVIPPGGLYIVDLHIQNPQRNQGSYSDFKKVDTLFFSGRAHRILGFEGLTTVFFRGKVSNTYPTQGFGGY